MENKTSFSSFFIIDEKKKEEKTDNAGLIMNGKTIHSLPELRENFDIEQVIKSYTDGTLCGWLKSNFYETEHMQISALSADAPNLKKEICRILKLHYVDTTDPKIAYKKELLKEFFNAELLDDIASCTATNQTELAELIRAKNKTIYLYDETFSIPIFVPGIKYIGVNNPIIENAYTSEQYKKAGIIVEGFDLPKTVDTETESMAKKAALANGFDFFYEEHSPLAGKIHKTLKVCEFYKSYRIPLGNALTFKEFKSKSECERAAEKCVRAAYDTACKCLSPEHSGSIYQDTCNYYCDIISSRLSPYLPAIKGFCDIKNKSALFDKLNSLISSSKSELSKRFKEEITDNREYYSMYDFSYFKGLVDIKKNDYRMEEAFFRLLETAVGNGVDYTFEGADSSILEMEKDITTKAASFFKAAHTEYLDYVSEIEKVAEDIGINLPEIKENENIDEYLIRIG